MKPRFQELDNQQTPLGELSLRVRSSLSEPGTDIYEVTLNGEFLMSSLINDSERALATLALDAFGDRSCEVLVGGLGLGCTAAAALARPNVQHVRVVEYLQPVIDWHRQGLVPLARELTNDPRCELLHADFYQHVREDLPRWCDGRYDMILLDIDHAPEALLTPQHAGFYTEGGLRLLCRHLRPSGIFALWSAEPPAAQFLDLLRTVFEDVQAQEIEFFNPLHGRPEANTVVLARLSNSRRSYGAADAGRAEAHGG